MNDPKWLEEDKDIVEIVEAKPLLVPPDFISKVFAKQHEALRRAHAHIDELHEVMRRILTLDGYAKFIAIFQEPPEVK